MKQQNKVVTEKAQIGAYEISLETGKIAKQASGSVIVRSGETVLLVTAISEKQPRPGVSFFPLSVEYRENAFASGKIPGGFFKREGRLSENEILTCRLIDRPIRPLFPDGYQNDTQIFAHVLSIDPDCDPAILAISGASAALGLSDVPFHGPIAGVRIGRVDGNFIANPNEAERDNSDIDIILAASHDAIVMVEGEADEITEAEMIDALLFGHEAIQDILKAQERLQKKAGKVKRDYEPPTFDTKIEKDIAKRFGKKVAKAYEVVEKHARYHALDAVKQEVKDYYLEKVFDGDADAYAESAKDISHGYNQLKRNYVRKRVVKEGVRIGGRNTREVRDIDIMLGWLPRAHGSAVFTRGETQAMVTLTLGTASDEQKVERFGKSRYKNFMLHYNFPPYSVGEVRPSRGPGRREIGHGNLAGRSIERVMPDHDTFPYTVRLVSDITESNGSSSMASVCGGSLAMMQAGVPIKNSIAGVAMGLIQEGKDIAILTDILGDEDHLGDMDFKVTGTRDGICAIQMDIKIDGLSREILENALEQAHEARIHILDRMDEVISAPEAKLSPYAPVMVSIEINPERIRDVIGPGGKNIRAITDTTGASINLEDSGKVTIAAPNDDACQEAIELIKSVTREVEVLKIYLGTVTSIKEFGAFVELLPGQEGFLHISELHSERVDSINDILSEGDEVLVKVTEVDQYGKIRLSRREALADRAREATSSEDNTESSEASIDA